ncbi:MAG: hypothetical protein R3C16_13265, partial [Hyphomonadaceae bacterium]
PLAGEFLYTRPRYAEARRVRAETVPGPGGKARFLCAPLSSVNDLFTQKSLFSVVQKTPEKSARFSRAPASARSARTFESRNEDNLPIPLTRFKCGDAAIQRRTARAGPAAGLPDMGLRALDSTGY